MCFSAQASFTASGILAVLGIPSMCYAKTTDRHLAFVPFIFALQQFCEGLIWLVVDGKLARVYETALVQGFLFFAYVIWPTFIPYALYRAETQLATRCALQLSACVAGLITSLFFLWQLVLQPVGVRLIDHSLQYLFYYPFWLAVHLLYGYATLTPAFFTQSKLLYSFGILVYLGHLAGQFVYSSTYPSIFCFFAALASLTLCLRAFGKVTEDNPA